MSRFTHAFCDACWIEENPDRGPVRMVGIQVPTVACCRCGIPHVPSIFVRADPSTLRCGGMGDYHDSDEG